MDLRKFFAELQRRNVYRAAVAYGVAAWLVIQAADIMLPTFDAPQWAMKALVTAAALGFPVAIILAWAFELTSEGIVRTGDAPAAAPPTRHTGRKLTALITVLACLAAGLFVLQKLRTQSRAPSAIAPSIAVLPLVNSSGDPAQEYFSDGLAEELIGRLGHIPELRVIGRTSSFQFKGRTADARTVGSTLGVTHLLEGSVRKAGDRVRISVALVNTGDGSQRWSQSYDRELTHIFALQEEIARSVAEQLRVTLLGGEPRVTAEPSNHSLEAYNAYLQGEFFFAHFNLESTRRSIEFHREAVRLDPEYAKAWAALAWSYCRLGFFSGAAGADAFVQGRAAAEKALALNPNIALARAALAYVHMNLDWNLPAAEAVLRDAVARAPRDAGLKNTLAILCSYQNRREEALSYRREAVSLDPLNVIQQGNLASDLTSLGRYDEAEAIARRAVELQPASAQIHFLIARIHLGRGKPDDALREAQLEPAAIYRRTAIALAQAARGDHAAADEALRELIEHHANDNPFRVALVYSFRGEADEAFDWLERAYVAHDPRVINTASDSFLRALHSDPRFAAFCRKVGLTPPGQK
jgi:serine/threonine-protein kinase